MTSRLVIEVGRDDGTGSDVVVTEQFGKHDRKTTTYRYSGASAHYALVCLLATLQDGRFKNDLDRIANAHGENFTEKVSPVQREIRELEARLADLKARCA